MSDVIAMTELELAMRKLANTVKLDTIEACAKVAEAFPQLIPTTPKHVRQVSGKDIAAAIRAMAARSPQETAGS